MNKLPHLLWFAPLAFANAQQGGNAPTDLQFAQRLAAILPATDELAWQSVPWRSQFRTALIEANKLDKPVLLWAMNGHPLGQT